MPEGDSQKELEAGTVIAGRYRVEKCVGRGGMGAVYLVRHTNTDERLALKVLHATILANALAVERFRREARVAAQVESDHVVRVTDADTAPELGGAPFLVMEFLKGHDLESEIEKHGAVSKERVVNFLRQAARALDKAHAIGIVHRDLKPENLFLTAREDGSPWVKILDFGIAKITGGSTPHLAGNKTETGTITGTPLYMSPEQMKGENSKVGPATDIWALGLIAFRLLTGATFWSADTLPMLVAQIAYEPLVPPSTRGSGYGPAFDAWFAKCCARSPEERFATAGQAIDALETALGLRASSPAFSATALGATAMAAPAPAALSTTGPNETSKNSSGPANNPAAAPALAGSLQGASVTMSSSKPSSARWAIPAGIGVVALGFAGWFFGVHKAGTATAEPGPSASATLSVTTPTPALPSIAPGAVPSAVVVAPTPTQAPTTTALSPRPTLSGKPVASATPSATPVTSAQPPPTVSATAPPATVAPPATTVAPPKCDPPFTIDATGHRVPKPGCY